MIQIIAFLIGSLLAVVICEFFKAKIEQRNCESNIAKRLSKDGKPKEYKGGYIIYANGTRWFVILWVTCELYWIPGLHGDDLEKKICHSSLEFKSTWLPRRKKIKLIKRIINTHPNLEAHGFWKIVKLFN